MKNFLLVCFCLMVVTVGQALGASILYAGETTCHPSTSVLSNTTHAQTLGEAKSSAHIRVHAANPPSSSGDECSSAITAVIGPNIVDQLVFPSAFDSEATNAKWYVFTPTVSGNYIAQSCGQGVDTRGWVLSGSCSNYSIVTTNDDYCALGSRLVWYATAGTSYYIVWDDAWDDSGFVFDLSLSSYGPVNVKLQVDASQTTVGPLGMFVGILGQSELAQMTDEGGGIYSYNHTDLGGTIINFIFFKSLTVNPDDSEPEFLPPGCSVSIEFLPFPLREYTLPFTNTVLPAVCFGQCTPCLTNPTQTVILTVDMSFNELLGNPTSPNGVHVAGNFQSTIGAPGDWEPGATPLNKIPGTSKYTRTFQLPNGEYEFKFLNGNTWGTDESVTDPTCGGAGGFGGNRKLVVNGNNVNVDVCFKYCVDCNTALIDTDDRALAAAVELRPNPTAHSTWLDIRLAQPTNLQVAVFNSMGNKVYDTTWPGVTQQSNMLDLSHLPAGVYHVAIRSDEAYTVKQLVIQK